MESAFRLSAASMGAPGFGWMMGQEHASVFLAHHPALEFGFLAMLSGRPAMADHSCVCCEFQFVPPFTWPACLGLRVIARQIALD